MNLDANQRADLAPFLEEGTSEHRTLEELIGRSLTSDSDELTALAQLGARHVRRAIMAAAYDRAVAQGAFDETGAYASANRKRRRPAGD